MNFYVKCPTPEVSEMLQKIAIANGYSWLSSGAVIRTIRSLYLCFENGDTILTGSTGEYSDSTKLTLEEAIEELQKKEKKFKVGDWVIGTEVYPPHSPRLILEYANNYCRYSDNCDKTPNNGNTTSYLRHATKEEIEGYLETLCDKRQYRDGQKIKPVYETESKFWTISNPEGAFQQYSYHVDEDRFYFNGTCVYCKGTWAEIIEDEFKINGVDRLEINENRILADGQCYSKDFIKTLRFSPHFQSITFKKYNGDYVAVTKSDLDELLNRMEK